jgi:hypothetical protein
LNFYHIETLNFPDFYGAESYFENYTSANYANPELLKMQNDALMESLMPSNHMNLISRSQNLRTSNIHTIKNKNQLREQIKILSEQILLQFKVITIVLNDYTLAPRNILELKFNLDDFIKKLNTEIKKYEITWTLEDSHNYEKFLQKMEQIYINIKIFIHSFFDSRKTGLPLRSLVLVLVTKSLEKLIVTFDLSGYWFKRLCFDLKEYYGGVESNTYTTILNAIEQQEITKSKYSPICHKIAEYLKNPEILKNIFALQSTLLQEIQTIRSIQFPQSFFPDLHKNYTLLRDTSFELETVINRSFCEEIGRSKLAYNHSFFPNENMSAKICEQIETELDQLDLDESSRHLARGRLKLDRFKQHLSSKVGIKSEYLQNYIAVVLVQQAEEVIIDGQDRQINFSFTVPGKVIQKLGDILAQFGISNILIRNSSNEPQTTITYNQNDKCAQISFTDRTIAHVDRPDSEVNIPIGRSRYFIKLYEDRAKLPEFNYEMYFDKEILQFDDGTELNLLQIISLYFNRTNLSQLSLEDRRLIVFNKILNDPDGQITLSLLNDNNLLKNKLGLQAEIRYIEEFKQIIKANLGHANEEATERFATGLCQFEIFSKQFINDEHARSQSMAQLATHELTLAQEQLRIITHDQKYPAQLRINGDIILKNIKQKIQEADVNHQYELAKRLHDIRYLIFCFAQQEFQIHLSEETLHSISYIHGKYLISLYLDGCRNLLPEATMNLISRFYPNLQILYIRNLSKFTKVGKFYNFPNLTELYLIDCPFSIFKIHAPKLQKLQVIDCPNLYELVTQVNNTNDIEINDYVIEECPLLITKINLPASCFDGLLNDYRDFQAKEGVNITDSLNRISMEVARGNYGLMFFRNPDTSCKTNKTNETADMRLTAFDEYLQKKGINNQYLRNYVALVLIQGSGEDILGCGRDLSFAYAASRLVCQKLNEIIRLHANTIDMKTITGVSNMMPKITYDTESDSVHIEFADSLSIYEDNGNKTQFGFARYRIILYPERLKLPDFACSLDLYNYVTLDLR